MPYTQAKSGARLLAEAAEAERQRKLTEWNTGLAKVAEGETLLAGTALAENRDMPAKASKPPPRSNRSRAPQRPDDPDHQRQYGRGIGGYIAEDPASFAKGVLSTPVTIGADIFGLAADVGNYGIRNALESVTGAKMGDFAPLPRISGDPFRKLIGLDPHSGQGMFGEMLDPAMWGPGIAKGVALGVNALGSAKGVAAALPPIIATTGKAKKAEKATKRRPALGTLFDEIYDYETAQKMAAKGEHLKFDKKKGRYVGSPDVTSPQALGALRKKIDKLVEAGSFNMDWYTRARETAVRFYPNDPAMQELFARGAAAYSPQADPGNELLAFLTQHNERMLTGEVVRPKTGAQMRNVERAYRNAPDEVNPESIKLGPKTGPYGDAKNPVIPEADLYKTANDIWHGRVMGYGDDFDRGFTATEHNYLTGENINLSERAAARDAASGTQRPIPWSPRAGQAATWGAKRKEKFVLKEMTKIEKKNEKLRNAKPPKSFKNPEAIARWQKKNDAKIVDTKEESFWSDLDERAEAYARYGIDDAADRHSAYITSEARTGENVSHLSMIGDGATTGEHKLVESYTDLVRDQASRREGMMDDLKMFSGDALETQGYYKNSAGEIELNPGFAHPILVGSDVKGAPRVRDADRAALDYVAHVGATMRGQEAGAWSKFFPEGMGKQKVGDMNSVIIEHGPMTEKTFGQLQAIAEKSGASIVNYGDSTLFVKFGDAGPVAGSTKEIGAAAEELGGDWKAIRGTMDSGYEPTGLGRIHPRTGIFKEDPHEATNALLNKADETEKTIPNIGERTADAVSSQAKAMNEIDAAIAVATGKPQRQDLVKLREILSGGGIPALREWVKKNGKVGLPAVLLPLLGLQENENALGPRT